jgi:hypothetical protein
MENKTRVIDAGKRITLAEAYEKVASKGKNVKWAVRFEKKP